MPNQVLTSRDNITFDAPTSSGTGTSVGGSVTINALCGVVITEALTTAAGSVTIITIVNANVTAGNRVLVTQNDYSGNAGIPIIQQATPTTGSILVVIRNIHGADALNGALTFTFEVGKPIV